MGKSKTEEIIEEKAEVEIEVSPEVEEAEKVKAAKKTEAEEKVKVKSKEEKEAEADKTRRSKVDTDNKKKAEKLAKDQEALARKPLNAEEEAFMARIAPKMNEGRAVMQPSSAEITRYSQLLSRKDVK